MLLYTRDSAISFFLKLKPPMDLYWTSTLSLSEFPLFHRKFITPINLRPKLNTKPTISAPIMIMARKKSVVEGVSDEMNKIASQNLDFAASRRRVRSAFAEVQQQLDHEMASPGIRTDEWYEINYNGQEIFCKSWLPKPGVRIKGITKQIAACGYGVYAIDHPGFGLSDGLHGYVSNFDDIVDNVIEQYTIIKGRPEIRGVPHFLLGQSMGGAVAIKVHLKELHEWDGVVLVAPMCKIAEDVIPPEPIAKVLTMLSSVVPKAKLVPQQDLAELAFRDLKKRKLASYYVICYNDQTRLKTAVELLKATNDIESQVQKISLPMLILHGAADKVTDPMVSQFLYEKASSKDKTLKLYEEGYHCILEGEPDDRIFAVIHDIITWLDSQCTVVH